MVSKRLTYTGKFQRMLKEECPFDPNGGIPKNALAGMAWLLKIAERTHKDYMAIGVKEVIDILRNAIAEAKNL